MGVSEPDKLSQRVFLPGALLLALLAGCTISPRRVVIPVVTPTPSVTPFPSPTPFPTPTPFPSPTPFASPTPMAMATPVARSVTQFLFTADPGSSAIIANRIHGDGSLSPVPGSPFVVRDAPRKVAALDHSLVVAGTTTLIAYAVDKNSGSLQATDSLALGSPSDKPPFDFVVDASTSVLYAVARGQLFAFRLSKGLFQAVSITTNPVAPAAFAKASNTPALDATGRFVYLVNTSASEIIAFHFDGGRLSPLSPPSYSAGQRPLSLAVVVP